MAVTSLTSLETTVRQIAGALDWAGRTWALVGGLAVSSRAGRLATVRLRSAGETHEKGIVVGLRP